MLLTSWLASLVGRLQASRCRLVSRSRRLRRRGPSRAWIGSAAEVLEVRSLLSAPTTVLGEFSGKVTISGSLAVPGEMDQFTFTLKHDSEVYFDSLTNSANFNWSLSGPAGSLVSGRAFNASDGPDNTGNPVLTLIAGDYTLTVAGAGATTGGYSFGLDDLAAAPSLAIGAPVSGTLAGGNGTNLYQFTAAAGDTYSFSSLATSGAGDDDWRLVDPYGNVVAMQALNTDLGTVTLAASGNYTLLLEGAISNTSDATYTVKANFLGNTPPVISGTPLVVGSTVNGTLGTPGQHDAYTFHLASNSLLYFDALTNNANFNWTLAGPEGSTVSNEQFTRSDSLTFTGNLVQNLVAGDYTLTIAGSSGATGAYSFRLSDLSAATALTPGTAVSATLAGGISTDLYQFTATAGQSFYIANQATSGSGGQNDKVRLIDPFGNIVPTTLNARLDTDIGRLQLNSSGRYEVLVEGYIGNTDPLNYTLNVIPEADPAPKALTLGSLVNGNLAVPGERDVYTFHLASNSFLYFDALTNNRNFNWTLTGPAGSTVSNEDFTHSDGLTFTGNLIQNVVAGDYTLTIAGATGTVGAYSFRLSDLSAVTALTPGTAVSGTLAGGISTDLYQFTATAGQSFYIANQATSGSGGQNDKVRLIDPFGNIVPVTLNSRLSSDVGRLQLNSSGRYVVLVEGYIGNADPLNYTLNVIPDVDPAPKALTLGSLVNGNLAASGEQDAYTFHLASNSFLYFDSLTNNANFNWTLTGPAGTTVSNEDFTHSDGLLFTGNLIQNLLAGDYTLTIAGSSGATGAFSFRLSDISSATALTPGTAVSGTLAGGISTDLYQFTATAGQSFYIANQAPSTSDRLRLIDPLGNIVPATLNSRLDTDVGRLQLNTSGRYVDLVEGYIGSPGPATYTLNVIPDVDPAPQALTLGSAVNGNLAASGEQNAYTFHLASNSLLYFDALTNNANFTWTLTGPPGTAVSNESFIQSDGITARVNPVLNLVAGDYTLTITAASGTTGAYSFRLDDLGAATSLALGSSVSGTLTGGNSTNLYQFTGAAGDSISFSSLATTGATSDFWRLIDPFGNIVAARALNSDLGTVTLSASGKYTLLVEGYIVNTTDATYTIKGSFLGNTPPVVSGTPLTLGNTVSGTLATASQTDAYTFTLASNALLYFDSLTNNANFNWTLSGPPGTVVSARPFNASDGQQNSFSPVLNLVAGTYTLTVASVASATGPYSFRLSDLAAATTITPGTAVSGTLLGGITTDLYQFNATAGQSFYFANHITSGSGGNDWRLIDPFGNLVSQTFILNTDPGRMTLASSGRYVILAEGGITNTTPLGYALNVIPDVDPAPKALTLGSTVNGNLAVSGEQDAYTFTLATNSLLYFDSLTNSFNFNWSLSGPEGTVVSGRTFNASDGQQLSGSPVLNLPAGTYTLTVSAFSGVTGAFSFRLSDIAAATALTPGTAVSGTLGGGNGTDLYQFTATVGQSFYFANHITSGSGSSDWRLVDPFGNVSPLGPTLNTDPGRMLLTSSGRYTILAEGAIFNTAALGYALNVIPDVDPAPKALTLGSTVNGNLAASGEQDAFTFTLATNSLLYFDSLTNSFNFNWSLSGPAGTAVSARSFNASDGLSSGVNPVLSLVAGNYTLTVAAASGVTGAYSFRLSDMAAATALTPGTAVSGTLLGGITTDLYQFTATAGQSFYFANHVTSGSGVADWQLIDPFGNVVSTSATLIVDPGRMMLTSSGRYTILAEGAVSNTTPLGYTLNVIPEADPAPHKFTLTGHADLTDTTPAQTLNAVEANSTGSVVLAKFSDGDPAATLADFTPSVDWGGGLLGTPTVSVQFVSSSANASNWQVIGTATYAEKGNYTVAVTVNDADGNTLNTSQTTFSVADAALTDTTPVATLNAVEGNSTGSVVVATFTDGNPFATLADFAPNVNWGGAVIGTPSAAVQLVSRSANDSTWQVVGTAMYAEKGTSTVAVTVNDTDGSSVNTSQTKISVADAALTDTTPAATLNAVAGNSTGTVVLASFSDGDPAATMADFTPSVDWGGAVLGAPTVSVQFVSSTANASNWEVVGAATYAEKGTFTVAVTVDDADGSSLSTSQTQFSVAGAMLTDTTPAATLNAVEGNSTGNVVLATFTDGNPFASLADFTPSVDWGGATLGTPSASVQFVSSTASVSTWQVVGTATYAEKGTFTVAVTVNDTGGSSFSTSQTKVNVADAILTDTTPAATLNAVEGNSTGTVVLATFTDGNPFAAQADFTPSVDWGGAVIGTPSVSVQFVSKSASVSNWQVVGTATYAEKGTYTVAVTVNDADSGSFSTSQTKVSVADAALTDTTPAATLNAVEGNSTGSVVVATFTDGNPFATQGDFTPSIDWGGAVIGIPSAAVQFVSKSASVSTWQVVGTATYAEKGTYTVAVTVNDADSSRLSTSQTNFSVADAALTDTTAAATLSAVEGNSTGSVVVATFTDGNPFATQADFTPSIIWGGAVIGTPSAAVQFVSKSTSVSTWQVVGTATYAEKGTYTVAVTVTDKDSGSLSMSQTKFSVADAALTDTTPAKTVNASPGTSTGPVVLATFTDGNPSAPSSDFSASVNWGGTLSGTPTVSVQLVTRTATTSTWQVVGTATYAASGTFTAAVTVTDADGNSFQTSQTHFSVTGAGQQQLLSYSIQQGETQRSFIRYIDLFFSNTTGFSGFVNGQGIRLTRYDVNGLHPTVISLKGHVKVNGTHVTIDFGPNGIGGKPSTTAGDGTYRLALTLAGHSPFSTIIQFTRLLGDANGDGNVDPADLALFLCDLKSCDRNGDINGDGKVDARDLLLITSAQGHSIKPPV